MDKEKKQNRQNARRSFSDAQKQNFTTGDQERARDILINVLKIDNPETKPEESKIANVKNSSKKDESITSTQTAAEQDKNSANVSQVDQDELARLKREIAVEQGLETEPNVPVSADNDEHEDVAKQAPDESAEPETEQSAQESQETAQPVVEESKDNEGESAQPETTESPEKPDKPAEENNEGEPEHQEVEYREKAEIDNRLKNNSNLSRVDDDEIARLKREIALEKGLISPEDVADAEEKENKRIKNERAEGKLEEIINPSEQKAEKLAEEANEEAERRAKDANRRAGDYSIPLETKKPAKEEDGEEKQKHHLFGHEHENIAPAESLPDDITDDEIQQVLEDQEKQAALAEEAEEQESYEGMTEEEIADAKERKKKFNELKQRYNLKEQSTDGEIGDYRKNLDFSVNTSIKRFRVKPPKKPFIISSAILAFLLIVAGLITYFVLNKPPAPVVLTGVKLSQPSIDQVVGQKVDLRGVYVTKSYSDDSEQIVFVNENMITAKTSNITADLYISSYRAETKLTFTIEGYNVDLRIKLTERRVSGIEAEIYGTVTAGQEIKFEDLHITATIRYYMDNLPSQSVDYMWIKDFSNISLAVADSETQLEKTATGFMVDSSLHGQCQLIVTYQNNGQTFTATLTVNVV